ncbi:Zn-dependent hydrolase [Persicobacter sp. CCB-QB2]|uniref:dipeptidyl-peptidase 3 family protein n=1 Tax=Persicobacter sp. CCB-QB2 TaxID=1561025 RepID=UPI0006A972F4|nr:Zn-dependent hydrolase [Persicobacter sp. CCB-QB2]
MKKNHILSLAFAGGLLLGGCQADQKKAENSSLSVSDPVQEKVNQYDHFTLTADLSHLSENQKKMIPLLIQVAEIMDDIFWQEAYGDKNALLEQLSPAEKAYAVINYGPWDRLENNKPFIQGVGEKPKGANYYPADMTKEEFEKSSASDINSLYTMVRRGEDGNLVAIPYHEFFKAQTEEAAQLLEQAADLAEDKGFQKYLQLRAKALRADEYFESDLAWMDMKDNMIDLVVGPIETYEDKLFGNKASHEAYVLIKDMEWSKKLAKFASFLPELQRNLPVAEAYKKEEAGTDSDLNAYDVVYYAGDCNAASKTIAINLPNDEKVQLEKGTRRLQLKNAMKAKFDKIMLPIASALIVEEQRSNVTFDAFFANTMFHEVAHGLGIKNTINNKGMVRAALKEHASALEEGKADILGLYMIDQLHAKGELEGEMKDYYTTFLAGIFRSVRFGAASAHGVANMIRFNYFKEFGAFSKDEATGLYRVNYEKMEEAVNALSEKILTLQGNGDYDGVAALVEKSGKISPELQADLDKLSELNIPKDVVFQQGIKELGL